MTRAESLRSHPPRKTIDRSCKFVQVVSFVVRLAVEGQARGPESAGNFAMNTIVSIATP